MNEPIQDEELAKADIRRQARLEDERRPWETTFREVDERFPNGAGGFVSTTPGQIRGGRNFDSTHLTSLERFAAAGVAITTPEEKDYIKPYFLDDKLNNTRSVKLWRERAGRRLQAIRHAAHTGFGVAANEDWDQLGRYGTSVVWQEAIPGYGLIYKTLHLSSCWIDTNVAGIVDTVHRKATKSARELEQLFKLESLTPKMRKCLEPGGNENTQFEVLHVVAPNTQWDADRLDYRRFPIASRWLALDEKIYLRRGGNYTSPVSCSRHLTSAGEKYGRSPAIGKMPNIQGVNAMKHTTLRAGHKAVDPALLFYDDDGVSKLVTKAGGLNPGMIDDQGRALVARMPGGENGIPYAVEMIQDEREQIKGGFLEDFYKILTDPNSRMTTTEVLEVMAKQGVLVRPYASRYAMEKQHPMTQRDLALALEAGQIEDFPPEVKEAGAWPLIDYENPLAAMARAEGTAKTMRWVELTTQLAAIDETVRDVIDVEAIARGSADEIGVKPQYVRPPDAVAARRQQREQQQEAAINSELIANNAGAAKDFAQAGQIAQGG